jgi:hypothetical protein
MERSSIFAEALRVEMAKEPEIRQGDIVIMTGLTPAQVSIASKKPHLPTVPTALKICLAIGHLRGDPRIADGLIDRFIAAHEDELMRRWKLQVGYVNA